MFMSIWISTCVLNSSVVSVLGEIIKLSLTLKENIQVKKDAMKSLKCNDAKTRKIRMIYLYIYIYIYIYKVE